MTMANFRMPALPDELKNGPEGIGIAFGVDRCRDTSIALAFVPGSQAKGLIAYIDVKERIPTEVGTLYEGKFGSLIRLGHYASAHFGLCTGQDNENTKSPTRPYTQAEIDGAAAELQGDTVKITLARVMLVMLATKVTFFQTNHHVGQDDMVGFVLKVVLFVLNIAPPKGNRSGIPDVVRKWVWGLGHTVSTKIGLYLLDVPGVYLVGEDGKALTKPSWQPILSDDVTKRMTSGVAGTMKTFDCVAILLRVAATHYALLVQQAPNAGMLLQAVKDIKANPAGYHIGARYITGKARLPYSDPPEPLQELCSALIQGSAPHSTLAKNKTLPPLSQVQENETYLACLAFRRAMVKTGAAQALLKDMRGKSFLLLEFGQREPTAEERKVLLAGREEDEEPRLLDITPEEVVEEPPPVSVPGPVPGPVPDSGAGVGSPAGASASSAAPGPVPAKAPRGIFANFFGN